MKTSILKKLESALTVAELISQLQELPQDSKAVVLQFHNDGSSRKLVPIVMASTIGGDSKDSVSIGERGELIMIASDDCDSDDREVIVAVLN